MGILTRMEQRARLENPSVPLSASNILQALGMEMPTPAGVTVTSDKALGITAFWAGVRAISQTIAGLPLQVFERVSEKKRRRASAHPIYQLLHLRPNPHMSAFTWKEMRTAHILTWGNNYSEIEYNGAGRPVALWPLLPDRTGVEIKDGKKVYWTFINGVRIWLSADRVLHVPGLGFDGIRGYNVIKVHRESLGLSIAANEYGAQFFGNSGKPSGVLTHPGKPGKEERAEVRDEWNQMHTGLTRAQRTAVLWGGMDWKQISIAPEEAQFLQTREMQIEEVARILNINPILLQHFSKATTWGSGVAQFLVAYGKFTIAPWLDRDEDVFDYDLFPGDERGRFYVKYNIDALLRGDAETQAKVLQIKKQNGVINADEWRELDEDNPLPNGQGQVYTIPLNMRNAAELVPEDDGAAGTGQDVQQTALNGAQIASLLSILSQVTAKLISPDTAKVALEVSFPTLSSEQINKMVDSAANFQSAVTVDDLRALGIKEKRERRDGTVRQRLREAHIPAFEDGVRRYLKRDIDGLKKAAKKAARESDPAAYLDSWVKEFYPGQQNYIRQVMLPLVSSLASAIVAEASDEVGAEPGESGDFSASYTDTLAMREAGASRGQVLALMTQVDPESLEDALVTRADEWNESRPGKVAQNEVVRVASGAARLAWGAVGLGAIWRASADACPICQEMNGRKVGASTPFVTAGDIVRSPDEATEDLVVEYDLAGPPLHKGCKCNIVPG